MKQKGRKIEDERFKHIATDPRFRGVPRSQRKVKIDNRFTAMFDDKRFKLKYVMDKRGRPIHSTTTEDLKKYYAVESSESENDDEDEDLVERPEGGENAVGDDSTVKPKSKRVDAQATSAEGDDGTGEDEEDSEAADDTEDEDEDSESQASSDEPEEPERDPARGIGNVETSSEEDESSEGNELEAEGDVAWGELDRDAPKSDDISRRLALCNLDWDKLRAHDLFMLLNSFKPPGGIVQRVSIYPSEFGKERMAVEQVKGPAELVEAARSGKQSLKSSGDNEEVDARTKREALRQYQLNRLRYYYAIAECDSAETADHLYRELDGREYESSGTCLDLRFVPDDMTFDEEPTSVADSVPDPQSYTPLNFVTSALQSVNVQLTWDEDDPRRTEAMQRAFKEDGDHDDLKVYLASSSSESEGEVDQGQGTDVKEVKKKSSMEAQIQKYRDLLKSLDDGEKKPDDNDDDVEMEVTWNPGLSKQVGDLVKKKQEQPEGKTPFQEFLEKRKEKRKLKRSLNKKGTEAEDSGADRREQDSGEGSQSDQAFSDDELPSDVDLGDDFFKTNAPLQSLKESARSKKKKKRSNVEDKAEDEETTRSKAELELLLMDEEDDGKHHFSLKKLLEENQAGSNKKRKRKAERKAAQKEGKADGDDFQVDLADPRFSALYDSHHYNIDPTDPHFKKTKGMEVLLTEKQRRRLTAPEGAASKVTAKLSQGPAPTQSEPQPPSQAAAEPKPSRQSLSSLASSVKLKVQQMKSRSKKLPS
ncbi:ESF1 homolog [Dermacentor variabilis]|uniref:ESF1 homolog n=1 Tax=Dermacentor variabilis TaxID=34621 RepID=UPI003F5BC40C